MKLFTWATRITGVLILVFFASRVRIVKINSDENADVPYRYHAAAVTNNKTLSNSRQPLKTTENEALKEKTLQFENKRKVLEEKINEMKKSVEEYKNELNSFEKTIKAKNNALKKNMPTPQNAQTVVKGHSVKPCQLIIKQKENVRV